MASSFLKFPLIKENIKEIMNQYYEIINEDSFGDM
jgi:hypothetical protein